MYEEDLEVVDVDKIWGPQSEEEDSINSPELDGIVEALPDGD